MPILFRRTKHKIRRSDAALRLLAGIPPGRVLDAPCGEGILASRLVALGHEVWACDLDPAALVPTDRIHFHVLDLNAPLPYPDGFFDAVASLEGIEHLEAPALCLQEFARILRAGGRLVLSTPNINNVQSRLHYFLTGRFPGFKTLTRRALDPPQRPVRWHVTVPYFPMIAFLLARHGLRLERVEITMIKTKQWFLLPLTIPMWLGGRRGQPETLARTLGSWKLLLGRSVIVRAVKPP